MARSRCLEPQSQWLGGDGAAEQHRDLRAHRVGKLLILKKMNRCRDDLSVVERLIVRRDGVGVSVVGSVGRLKPHGRFERWSRDVGVSSVSGDASAGL